MYQLNFFLPLICTKSQFSLQKPSNEFLLLHFSSSLGTLRSWMKIKLQITMLVHWSGKQTDCRLQENGSVRSLDYIRWIHTTGMHTTTCVWYWSVSTLGLHSSTQSDLMLQPINWTSSLSQFFSKTCRPWCHLPHQPTPASTASLTSKASPIKGENTDCAKHLAPVYSAFFNLTQTRSHFAKNFSADIKKNMHTKYTVTDVFVSDSPHKKRAEQHRVLAVVSRKA